MSKKGIIERLKDGPVIGDGGFVMQLERRGYVTAGKWTPEASYFYPEAVTQLHREFLRAGSDVMQVFTFYSSDDHLLRYHGENLSCEKITHSACEIAKKVANEGNALVAGGVSQNEAYNQGKGKEYIQREVKKQVEIYLSHGVDFIICEFFHYMQEMEWSIEEARKYGLPVMATMAVGEKGSVDGVSLAECAVRMAKAKADIVGLNCMFDPFMSLANMKIVKKALESENLKPFLAVQPNGFFTTNYEKWGYLECPEFPYGMEARTITRMDALKYAKEALDMGINYIGGCCGFEAYHIRIIAEEVAEKTGRENPIGSENTTPLKKPFSYSKYAPVKLETLEYWENLVPESGRRRI